MKFTQRQANLLSYLYQYETISLKQLAKQLDVTIQTVKSELQVLGDVFISYGISIDIRSGKDIVVHGRSQLSKLIKMTEINLEFPVQQQILLILVLNKKYLVLQDIADELYISKSLVEKIMPSLLKQYPEQIKSQRHYGYIFNVSEVNRRELFVKLLSPYLQGTNYEEGIRNFSSTHFELVHYFSKDIIEQAKRAINNVLYFHEFQLTDESLKMLFLYLIYILRIKDKNLSVDISPDFFEAMSKLRHFEQYMNLTKRLNEEVDLGLSKEELIYLSYLFLTLKKQVVLNRDEILKEMRSFVMNILDSIYDVLMVNLRHDVDLIEGLSYHIYTGIFSKETYKQWDSNSNFKDIKLQYPLGFEMATIAARHIKIRYDFHCYDNDLIYLTLHFQAAIERLSVKSNKIEAVVVCHYGVAASNLISTKIQRYHPEINVLDTYSVHEFEKLDRHDFDLIISTEKLMVNDVEVIYISPSLKEFEMNQIDEFIRIHKAGYLLENKIKEATILHLDDVKDTTKIIHKMVQELETNHKVDKRFLESVLEREKVSPTGMQYFAIPHGNPEYVIESKLIITRLKNGMEWNGALVKCIFMFAFSSGALQENPMMFSMFYRKLAELDFEIKLKEHEKDDDIIFKEQLLKLFY